MSFLPVNMTYEPFAKEPEYIAANQAFVAAMPLAGCRRLLDLACGIGTMTRLLRERQPGLAIIGLDLSAESLAIARDGLACLVRGTADRLPFPDRVFDAVVMGNAIHMLPDPDRLLAEVRRVLVPGGFFAFNSSFYAGTMPKGTEAFHHEWMRQALACLAARPGLTRKRGTRPAAFSRPWPSPQEWAAVLARHGLGVVYRFERPVLMTRRSFETIGAYGGFAQVILSGYPVAEASFALQSTAAPALAAVAMTEVPRLWLEVIAS
ncbi:MAG: class I SAM-dependent methyltransferase [Thermodesulfobacteriota bacterium]